MGTNFAPWKARATMSFDAEVGDDEAGEASEDGENDAFGEGLADEAFARCAEGEADGGLRRGARLPRASSRLAMLAQAMSRTRQQTASRMRRLSA